MPRRHPRVEYWYDQSVGCDQFTGLAQPWIAHPDNVRSFFRTGSTVSNNVNVSAAGDNSQFKFDCPPKKTNRCINHSLVLRGTGLKVAYLDPPPPADFGAGQFGGRY